MARPCTVCTSLDRDAIDLELTGSATLASIAAKHGVTTDSLRRHKARHVTPALVAVARRRLSEAGAVTAYQRLEELVLRANRLLDRAERKGALVAGAQILGQLRQTLETVARITGELDTRSQVNVLNVVASTDWQELRAVILAALVPYPDARLAVASALTAPGVLEVGP